MIAPPGEDDPDAGQSVLNEQSVHEPEEFDPESLGPSPPEPPSTPRPPRGGSESDAVGLFWKLVLVFNVALLALALGPMLAYFDGRVDLGIRVFLLGLVAFAYGTVRYIKFRRNREENETADS